MRCGGPRESAEVGPQGRARGRGSRRRRARRYLSASAVAVAPRPAGRAGRPRLPQQRGAGPRSGPRSRSRSGARSSLRSRSRAAGLRMLGAGRPRRAGARLARLAASPRPALTPPASRGGRGAHCAAAAAAGCAPTSQRGVGPGGAPAALRQQLALRDGRRALRPLRGRQAAARGASGGTRPRGRACDWEGTGPRSLPGGGALAARPVRPAVVMATRGPSPRRASVTSWSRHLTSRPGGAAGRGQRADRSTSGRVVGRAGWGREEKEFWGHQQALWSQCPNKW